ncbi:MAG: LytTR family DNA-binding domain-containing protein [Saprospiraceae bacterium]
MKAIIIDDEPQSQEVLKKLLEKGHPDINVAACGSNITEGFALIQRHQPDLVFLDIEMPGGTGFDLLEQIGHPSFYVVFITAHNQYAITAIRSGALDYLLKPVTSETLGKAMGRVHEKYEEKLSTEQWKVAFEAFQQARQQQLPTRITVSTLEGIHYVPIEDIVRFEADGGQTEIFINGSKKRLIASLNLGGYVEQFEPYPAFMQVQRSHLVNLYFVDRYVKTDGGYLVMKDSTLVPVSKLYKEELLRRLAEL